MYSGAGDLTHGPQAGLGGAALEVGLDPAHGVVESGSYRQKIASWVQPESSEHRRYPGKPGGEVFHRPGVEPGSAHGIGRRHCSCHDVAWRQLTAGIEIEGKAAACAVQENRSGA